jgi:hypothetical protein
MNKHIETSMYTQNTYTFLLIRDISRVRLIDEIAGLVQGEAEII